MPDLVPVENDPFSVNLQPVEYDPFGIQPYVPPAAQSEAMGKVVSGLSKQAGDVVGGALTLPGNVAGRWIDPLSDEGIGRAADLAGMMTLGAGAASAERDALGMGIRAYHGSPHDFEKFDLGKIGTGEGAQAYGHGLYFAENPKTAEEYRKALGDWQIGDKAADPLNPEHVAAATLEEYGGDRAKAIHDLTVPYREVMKGLLPPEEARVAAQATELLKNSAELPKATKGKTYEVNINADPEHFLDFDKPFSQQSPKVQEAINKLWTDKGGKLEGRENPPFTASSSGDNGESIHAAIATTYGRGGNNAAAQAAASEKLREAGIPGIKYLDQGSRGSGEGTSNYVVFNDKLIDIIKKYGLAGLVAGGAAHFKTTPVEHDPFAQ